MSGKSKVSHFHHYYKIHGSSQFFVTVIYYRKHTLIYGKLGLNFHFDMSVWPEVQKLGLENQVWGLTELICSLRLLMKFYASELNFPLILRLWSVFFFFFFLKKLEFKATEGSWGIEQLKILNGVLGNDQEGV